MLLRTASPPQPQQCETIGTKKKKDDEKKKVMRKCVWGERLGVEESKT